MVAVQLMCSRLGMVTGRGLAGVIRRRYRRRVLWTACGLLAIANVFNTVDYQFIADPGDNAARGPVSVVSLRLHVQQVAGHD